MKLYSTRNLNEAISSKEAIIKGLSNDGGLYFAKFEDIVSAKFDIKDLLNNSYKDTAKLIFNIFLDDYSNEELNNCINNAYNIDKWSKYNKFNTLTPITKIGKHYLLELYHGPTSAFKDVALTILPQFLTTAYNSFNNNNSKVYILTATSGDTGKAALSGFMDVANTMITVFYPTCGVSNIQKLQMQTAEGNNVSVIGINGNFDDCQKLVKHIYTNQEIHKKCDENNIILSSANSINIGRLVPQIVYYIQAYIDLVNNKEINLYDKVNFVVPTGNFGDILAGYIAKVLGLPINKLICASNENNVLTDFINTGIYDKNRELHKTMSPSMDILVSSNLERLLFLLSGNDDKLILELMNKLNTIGKYEVNKNILDKIKESFSAYHACDKGTTKTIKYAFETDKRLIDTHTAVAYKCLMKYQDDNPDDNSKCIILSTASPYKFTKDVLRAIDDKIPVDSLDDFTCIDKLYEITKEEIPENIYKLKEKTIRFKQNLSYDEGIDYVKEKIRNKEN